MSRQNRKRNVIVSRLVSPKGISDTILVEKLVEAEFGVHPKIVRTRRLGQRKPGDIRSLRRCNDYSPVAKFLRQPCNAYIQKAIYFNPDMTKAEYQAAYEQRIKRRLQNV